MAASDYLARKIGFETYAQYLRSEHWKLFSEAIKQQTPQCYCCRFHNKLQVHHINYERLGGEWPSDVIVVCDKCHKTIHELGGKDAHIILKKKSPGKKQKQKSKPKKWVKNWRQLVNQSTHQTITQLQQFLQHKGLLNEISATSKAFKLGFSKTQEDKTVWNLKKYIQMMQADKKLKKLIRQGKEIHPKMYYHALEKIDNTMLAEEQQNLQHLAEI